MNTSFANNLTAADMVARQVISERVADAQVRAQVRAARAARRTARRQARPVALPRTRQGQTHELPVWAARFMFPVR